LRKIHANLTLVVVSILIILLICEFAARAMFEQRQGTLWKRPLRFAVLSDSVWEFNAELGWDYVPQARMDMAWMQNGVPRRCGTFVTGSLGSPGKGIDPTKVRQAKYIVLGDSFTATVHQGETWPDILSKLFEERSGSATPILNLARDGYAVLQMFDQAAYLLRAGHRPQAFIISIIGSDLERARLWRMTFRRNGTIEEFTSNVPSLDISPETHVRAGFIDPRMTRAWCDSSRAAGQSDETGQMFELGFDKTWRADEAFFRPRVGWLSVTDCYLCNRILTGPPTRGITRSHTLNRFQDDPRFLHDLALIRASGVPIWLIYLPYEPELRSAQRKMTPREQILFESLKQSVDRFVDLTPEKPMGDAATALTLLPEDAHPSRAGLQYYATEAYQRLGAR
jgi:hypothetical protein